MGGWVLACGACPQGRGGAGVVAAAGRVVVVGGFAGEETNEMWCFDTSSGAWQDWSTRSAGLVKRSVMGVGVMAEGERQRLVLFGGEVGASRRQAGRQGLGTEGGREGGTASSVQTRREGGLTEGHGAGWLAGYQVDPSSQGHEGAGGFAGDTLALDLLQQEGEGGWQKLTPLDAEQQPSPR